MKLPKQAKPVMRTMSTARIEAGVGPSNCPVCNLLPGALREACRKEYFCD